MILGRVVKIQGGVEVGGYSEGSDTGDNLKGRW